MATRTTESEGAAAGGRFKREVSTVGLLFVSLGSIIGSGWLFGALYASQIAGPAAALHINYKRLHNIVVCSESNYHL